MRSRLRLLTTGIAAVLLTAAATALAAPAAQVARPDSDLVAARAAAQRILAAAPLPADAIPRTTDDSIGRTLSASAPAQGGQLVDRVGYWTVDEPPAVVAAFVRAHPPARSRAGGTVSGGTPPFFYSETRSLPDVPGRLSSETVQIAVAAAPGGVTAMRVDGLVLWRPSWERIPLAARSATVALDGVAQRSLGARGVATLRRQLDGEPVTAPGAFSCPAGVPGQSIRVTFAAGARHLASVTYDSADGCGFLGVRIGRRRAPALFGGAELGQRLWSLHSLTACSARQLTVSVSRPTERARQGTARIVVRNHGVTPCSLEGHPSMTLPLRGGVERSRGDQAPAGVVTAPVGGSLIAGLSWTAAERTCGRPAPRVAIVELPGIAHRFVVAVGARERRLGPCRGALQAEPLLAAFPVIGRHP